MSDFFAHYIKNRLQSLSLSILFFVYCVSIFDFILEIHILLKCSRIPDKKLSHHSSIFSSSCFSSVLIVSPSIALIASVNDKHRSFSSRVTTSIPSHNLRLDSLTSSNPIFLFHLGNHLCELFLAFFYAAGVDVSGDAFAVHDRRVPSFPHVLADLMDRTCSLPSVLAFIRLKFRPWRVSGCFRSVLARPRSYRPQTRRTSLQGFLSFCLSS